MVLRSKKLCLFIVVFSFLVLQVSSPIHAQKIEGIGPKIGLVSPEVYDSTLVFGAVFDLGLTSFLGGISPDLKAESSVDYWQSDFGQGVFQTGTTLRSLSFNSTTKYYFPMSGSLSPFAGVGLSLVVSIFDFDSDITPLGATTSDLDVGIHIVGGADFSLGPKMTLRPHIKYNLGGIDNVQIGAALIFGSGSSQNPQPQTNTPDMEIYIAPSKSSTAPVETSAQPPSQDMPLNLSVKQSMGNASAVVDGALWEADITAFTRMNVGKMFGSPTAASMNTLVMMFKRGEGEDAPYDMIAFMLMGIESAGAYPIGVGEPGSVPGSVMLNMQPKDELAEDAMMKNGLMLKDGELNITSFTKAGISGTFHCTAAALEGNKTMTIADGKFEIEFPTQ